MPSSLFSEIKFTLLHITYASGNLAHVIIRINNEQYVASYIHLCDIRREPRKKMLYFSTWRKHTHILYIYCTYCLYGRLQEALKQTNAFFNSDFRSFISLPKLQRLYWMKRSSSAGRKWKTSSFYSIQGSSKEIIIYIFFLNWSTEKTRTVENCDQKQALCCQGLK